MNCIIYRSIKGRIHYWNTCGWTLNKRTARIYREPEAQEAFRRMNRVGINPVIARL